jgi:hypothetical protein
MFRQSQSRKYVARIFSLTIALLMTSSGWAQEEKEKKSKAPGKPVLWQQVNISRRNLILGPGGESMIPDLRRVTFIKKEEGGTNEKYRIKDAKGRVWVAKPGKEAQSETAAVRLIWALGYKSEINYLVPTITIPTRGTFANVRLEARPDDIDRLDEWKWKENPFVNTPQLKGLKIMMALINNWDLKDENNKVLRVEGTNIDNYIISDLGATFGKTGSLPFFWKITRSRNKPKDYVETKFINEVEGRHVNFNYTGRNKDLFDNMTVEDTRWIASLLSQLSDKQIKDAFRAARYTPSEVESLSQTVRDRIMQLQDTAGLIKLPVRNSNKR